MLPVVRLPKYNNKKSLIMLWSVKLDTVTQERIFGLGKKGWCQISSNLLFTLMLVSHVLLTHFSTVLQHVTSIFTS